MSHKARSEKKLLAYLVKYKIDTTNVYFTNSTELYSSKFVSDSSVLKNHFRPIQFRVFDSSGKIVNIWANCYGPMSYYFKDVNDLLHKKLKKDMILSTSLNDYTPHMRKQPVIDPGKYDIIILAYWEWYMEHHSTDMLKQIQALPNASNKKVLLIKLNLDNSKP